MRDRILARIQCPAEIVCESAVSLERPLRTQYLEFFLILHHPRVPTTAIIRPVLPFSAR